MAKLVVLFYCFSHLFLEDWRFNTLNITSHEKFSLKTTSNWNLQKLWENGYCWKFPRRAGAGKFSKFKGRLTKRVPPVTLRLWLICLLTLLFGALRFKMNFSVQTSALLFLMLLCCFWTIWPVHNQLKKSEKIKSVYKERGTNEKNIPHINQNIKMKFPNCIIAVVRSAAVQVAGGIPTPSFEY